MLICSLLWLFRINSTMTLGQIELAAAAFLARCGVTWFYSQGKNWARYLSMFYSAFAIARLFQIKQVEGLVRELWLGEAALGAFLLVLLAQADVNAWFVRNGAPPAAAQSVSNPIMPPPPPDLDDLGPDPVETVAETRSEGSAAFD